MSDGGANQSVPPFKSNELPFVGKGALGKINKAIANINQVSPLTGGAGVNVATTPNGATVNLSRLGQGYIDLMIGKVVQNGPLGEPDFTSNYYWVQLTYMVAVTSPPDYTNENNTLQVDPGFTPNVTGTRSVNKINQLGMPYVVAVRNISEETGGSHNIPYGEYVLYKPISIAGKNAGDSAVGFIMDHSPSFPQPQYQYQAWTATSQHQAGWNYYRFHALI